MSAALPYSELSLHWQGQLLTVRYMPVWAQLSDYAVAHLEVRSDKPLPMTQTGYRSHFLSGPPEDFDPLAYVSAWLEDAAKDPAWRAQQELDRQGCLF
ncbi:hypothetical protein KUW09_25075 [Mameliella alba]|nr:hypothetical protein [Antarctobacter heliothermus]MBY6147336.1 hypothetical protein [Mameliella alba]MCA0957386.1 hypothetical protein [Mameliella alba]